MNRVFFFSVYKMDFVCLRFIGRIEKTFVLTEVEYISQFYSRILGPGVPAIHYMKINTKTSEVQSSSADQFHIQIASSTFIVR